MHLQTRPFTVLKRYGAEATMFGYQMKKSEKHPRRLATKTHGLNTGHSFTGGTHDFLVGNKGRRLATIFGNFIDFSRGNITLSDRLILGLK